MVTWINTHCFDFFSCNLILSQYLQNYTHLPHPHLYSLICLKLLLIIYHVTKIINHTKLAKVHQHNTNTSNCEY